MLGDSMDQSPGRMGNVPTSATNKARLENITTTPIGMSPNVTQPHQNECESLKEIIKEKDDTINQLSMQITEVGVTNAGVAQDSGAGERARRQRPRAARPHRRERGLAERAADLGRQPRVTLTTSVLFRIARRVRAVQAVAARPR